MLLCKWDLQYVKVMISYVSVCMFQWNNNSINMCLSCTCLKLVIIIKILFLSKAIMPNEREYARSYQGTILTVCLSNTVQRYLQYYMLFFLICNLQGQGQGDDLE